MKQRILTATIALPLVLIILFGPVWIVTVAVMAASVIGLWEYFGAVKMRSCKPLNALGYLAAVIVPLGCRMQPQTVRMLADFYLGLLFFLYLYRHKTIRWEQIALLVMGILYIPFLLSHIIEIRSLDGGRFYIWLVFIGAFLTDTCAYFVGVGLGKHKLCPEISPKKTVEGAVGGVIGCGLSFLLFGLVVNTGFGQNFSLIRLFGCGMFCSVISELGDLVASMLKRQCGIKDFGNLLPGHGGILDRCDSIILVAPAVLLFLQHIGVLA